MPYKDGNPTLGEQLEADEMRRFYTDDILKEARQDRETIKALRAVVVDMLAGLEYLRATDRVPYGFGIDRLEATGKAALALCN